MWIETIQTSGAASLPKNSFASNGECGLKRVKDDVSGNTGNLQFIRQQWRMWIETLTSAPLGRTAHNSFASNGECGLKRSTAINEYASAKNSFASNGECGLKP